MIHTVRLIIAIMRQLPPYGCLFYIPNRFYYFELMGVIVGVQLWFWDGCTFPALQAKFCHHTFMKTVVWIVTPGSQSIQFTACVKYVAKCVVFYLCMKYSSCYIHHATILLVGLC